jgi:hypothetical protein
MEMASFRALPMFLVDSCAPLPCTKSRRRPATLSFSPRSSAYLCDLCVERALKTQRSQRYAEDRREIRLFVQSRAPALS